MSTFVAAPAGAGLRGRIRVPGDKSVSHRALLLAARAEGRSRLSGLSSGEDVAHTLAAIQAFGAGVATDPAGVVVVDGGTGRLGEPDAPIFVGNSGTGIRLLAGWATAIDGLTVLSGDASIARRPYGPRRRAAAVHGRKDRRASRRPAAAAGDPGRRAERDRLPPPGSERPGQGGRSPRWTGGRRGDDGARGRPDPAAHRRALAAVRRRHRDRRRLGHRPPLPAATLRPGRARRPVPGRLLARGRLRHPGQRVDGGSRLRRSRTKWLPGCSAAHGGRHRGRRRRPPHPHRPPHRPVRSAAAPPTSAGRKYRR